MPRSPSEGPATSASQPSLYVPKPIGDGATSAQAGTQTSGITLRVVILSLALALAFGYMVPIVDFKLRNTFLGAAHLPPGAVGVLLVLTLVVNPLLRLLSRPRGGSWALSRNEALTVYITCLFSSLVPGHGAENFIIPNLLAPFYFATNENGWLSWLGPVLKPWLTPALNADGTLNEAVTTGWFMGGAVPWAAWIVPLLFWGSFVLVSYAMLGCLSVILRAQWAEKEALAFPLLRLPLAMTEDMDRAETSGIVSKFFQNRVMWVGFGLAVFVQGVRGLHLYFPDVPDIPLGFDTGPLFSEAPWNQIGWVPVTIFPLVVGITYLLTSEISFSLWFFFWFFKFQYIAAHALGYQPNALPGAQGLPDKVFTGYQQFGCYLAYVGLVLWTGREHLRHVARRAFRRTPGSPTEREEVLSYPVAFWGFVGCFAIMVGASMVAGVRFDIAVALWVSYLVLAIGLTRIAVEGGLLGLQHHTSPLGAIGGLFGGGGTGWLTQSAAAPAAFFQAGMVNHMRGFIMPSFLHSFKLARDEKIPAKPLGLLIAATIVISMAVSWWTAVRLGYDNGGLALQNKFWAQEGSRMPVGFLDNLRNGSGGSPGAAWLWTGVGGFLTFAMIMARNQFVGFPLHPIGYLTGLTYPGATFWASIFVGWLCKVLITRFGGNETYRKTTPAFLGLVLGDVTMMLFWLLVDGWTGRSSHALLPI